MKSRLVRLLLRPGDIDGDLRGLIALPPMSPLFGSQDEPCVPKGYDICSPLLRLAIFSSYVISDLMDIRRRKLEWLLFRSKECPHNYVMFFREFQEKFFVVIHGRAFEDEKASSASFVRW